MVRLTPRGESGGGATKDDGPPNRKGTKKPHRSTRSSSYSDDYRITPELQLDSSYYCTGPCCPPSDGRTRLASPIRETSVSHSRHHRGSSSPPVRHTSPGASYRYSSPPPPPKHTSGASSQRYSSSPSRYSPPSRYSSPVRYSSPQRHSSSPSRYSSPQRYGHSPTRYSRSPSRYSPGVSPQRGSSPQRGISPQRSTGSCSTCCSGCLEPDDDMIHNSPCRPDGTADSPHRHYRRHHRHADRATESRGAVIASVVAGNASAQHTCASQAVREGSRATRRSDARSPTRTRRTTQQQQQQRSDGTHNELGPLCTEHSKMVASISRREELSLLISNGSRDDSKRSPPKQQQHNRRSSPDRTDNRNTPNRRDSNLYSNDNRSNGDLVANDNRRRKSYRNERSVSDDERHRRSSSSSSSSRRRKRRERRSNSRSNNNINKHSSSGSSPDRRRDQNHKYSSKQSNRSGEAFKKGRDSEKKTVTSPTGSKRGDILSRVSLTTFSNKDIIHHMVSQTKAQKKHIRSLENEVERLRGVDVLAQCEVRQRDVEWRPGDVLGEGSFSTVYRGTFCGIDVAVKELKLKLSQDDKNYFRSEAALLQQLHHPRVVLLMGVCSTAARPFMLLEYMMGGSLHALIHGEGKNSRLDHATYFCIARDVAQGVNYLHKHDPQVLHLDLKSMNVLLDSYIRAKIADFGFSILRRSRSPAERGAIRGTPAWMAPELLTKGEVSAKCDVYSYAIILWEMLTSQQPFRGYDVLQILESVEAGMRPPLPPSNVSRELRELITSCWAQNAALRPSFAEVLGALEEASVPPSWRGLFQRAQLPTSLPQDPPMARNVIKAVQESVETLRRVKLRKAEPKLARSASARGEISLDIEKSSSPTRINRISGNDKRRDKEQQKPRTKRRSDSKARDNSTKRDGSRTRDKSKVRDRSRVLDLNKLRDSSRVRDRSLVRNKSKARERSNGGDLSRDPARRRYSKSDALTKKSKSNRNGPTRTETMLSRDISDDLISKRNRSPNKKSPTRSKRNSQGDRSEVYRREDINLNRKTRKSSHGSSNSSELQQDSLDGSWSSKQNWSSEKRDNYRETRRDSAGESQYSSWSSDDVYSKPYAKQGKKSYSPTRRTRDVSRGRESPRRSPGKQKSPVRQSSPMRRDSPPHERMKSPDRQSAATRRRDDIRRRDSWAGHSDKPGLLLTAEQLMDQKQRLRPVRPSELPDISNLPEQSLQDLTVLLRRAMNRRRDAFPPSMPSDDQYSDWH